MTEPLSLSMVLFSGTDDKLTAASVLAVGAASLDRPVRIFLQYWALDAFRADRIEKDHGAAPEAGREGAELLHRFAERGGQHWSETLRQIKEIGDVRITACSLSMDILGIGRDDLDPLVDGIEGIAGFTGEATGQLVFI
ncbi:MAG TPA: DsrE/DsrF/DrsH-like family protein [Actinomycetota bacterium]